MSYHSLRFRRLFFRHLSTLFRTSNLNDFTFLVSNQVLSQKMNQVWCHITSFFVIKLINSLFVSSTFIQIGFNPKEYRNVFVSSDSSVRDAFRFWFILKQNKFEKLNKTENWKLINDPRGGGEWGSQRLPSLTNKNSLMWHPTPIHLKKSRTMQFRVTNSWQLHKSEVGNNFDPPFFLIPLPQDFWPWWSMHAAENKWKHIAVAHTLHHPVATTVWIKIIFFIFQTNCQS